MSELKLSMASTECLAWGLVMDSIVVVLLSESTVAISRTTVAIYEVLPVLDHSAYILLFAFLNTLLANSTYSFATPISCPSLSATFSQCTKPPSTSVHASSSECSSTHLTYSASCQPCRLCGSGTGERTRIWCSTMRGGRAAVCFGEARSVFSRNRSGLAEICLN